MTKFFGTLWMGNIEQVAALVKETLEGKKYAFAAANLSYPHGHIDMHTSQVMREIHTWLNEEQDSLRCGGFTVSDTYGVWGASTSQQDNHYDHEFRAPYIVVGYDEIQITQLNGPGDVLQWTIKVQGD